MYIGLFMDEKTHIFYFYSLKKNVCVSVSGFEEDKDQTEIHVTIQ